MANANNLTRDFACPPDGETIEFRGVIFDDGWEFDAPCIIYFPIMRYSIGGNIGHLETMIEDVCIDLTTFGGVRAGWSDADVREFEWRGWDSDLFSSRVGHHVTQKVRFYREPGKGYMNFDTEQPLFEFVDENGVRHATRGGEGDGAN